MSGSEFIGHFNTWIAMSGLQKAIRRGDVNSLKPCVAYLSSMSPKTLLKRLLIIAFEDIGGANTRLIPEILKLASSKPSSVAGGLTEPPLAKVISMMANSPKNRAMDYLYNSCRFHPDFAEIRSLIENLSDKEAEALLCDPKETVFVRNLALMKRIGIGADFHETFKWAKFDVELYRFLMSQIGADQMLVETCIQATRKICDEFSLNFPLLLKAVYSKPTFPRVETQPEAQKSKTGLPFYFLDPLHTRTGKQAIKIWRDYIPSLKKYTLRQLAMAVFTIEGIVTYPTYSNLDLDRLEKLGFEADLYKTGISLAEIPVLFDLVKQNFSSLNEAREQVI